MQAVALERPTQLTIVLPRAYRVRTMDRAVSSHGVTSRVCVTRALLIVFYRYEAMGFRRVPEDNPLGISRGAPEYELCVFATPRD